MFVLETQVSYPPNAQMRLAASFVRFLHKVRNSPPAVPCDCPDCSHTERLRAFWSQYRNVRRLPYCRNNYADHHFADLCQRISHYDVTWCEACEQVTWSRLTHNVGTQVCEDCYSQFHYCNRCQAWYHNDDDDEHQHEEGSRYSHCKAPHEAFKFPARCLDREISNDERVTVTLPSGLISDEGISSIFRYVNAQLGDSDLYYALADHSHDLGQQWTTREGSFPKRIAKLCLQNGVKLTPTLLTQIGNLARQHTSTQSEFHIELTRDFSAGPLAFVNAGSCWFSDYWQSLCMFKQAGGLALRTYTDRDSYRQPRHSPVGRAWVMPLSTTLQPTHDTDTYAYVLFNVYGLSQYEAAHILAQMTGKSYRKIEFRSGMYVNSGVGFLVASQAVCNDSSSIALDSSSIALDSSRSCRCPYGR